MPALLEIAVRPVTNGILETCSINVSGTPQGPKPPQRSMLLLFKSLSASAAELIILLTSLRRAVKKYELRQSHNGLVLPSKETIEFENHPALINRNLLES